MVVVHALRHGPLSSRHRTSDLVMPAQIGLTAVHLSVYYTPSVSDTV